MNSTGRRGSFCAVLVVLIGCWSLAAAAAEFAGELRGLDFGAPKSSVSNLAYRSLRGNLSSGIYLHLFSRRSDNPRYRGVPLSEIFYGFRNGKVEVVEHWRPSPNCSDDSLLHALKARFGEPQIDLGGYINQSTAPEADCQRLGPVSIMATEINRVLDGRATLNPVRR